MLSIFPEEYSFEKVIVMLQYYDQSRKKCCSWIYFYERKTTENNPKVPKLCSFDFQFVQKLLFIWKDESNTPLIVSSNIWTPSWWWDIWGKARSFLIYNVTNYTLFCQVQQNMLWKWLLLKVKVTFLFQCRKITNFFSLSAFCQGTSIKLKIPVIFKAYKWITNWIKFHSRYDTIYFNVLLSY